MRSFIERFKGRSAQGRIGDFSSTWIVDFCRGSDKEGPNLQKSSVTGGFRGRCQERSGTVIESRSNSPPLPSTSARILHAGVTSRRTWKRIPIHQGAFSAKDVLWK